ncbi:MAG: hypothetical protein M1404_02865, partial [Acidobacteria bacterium]|nr:hypothetical protein [Acidobacteriota bacterium]
MRINKVAGVRFAVFIFFVLLIIFVSNCTKRPARTLGLAAPAGVRPTEIVPGGTSVLPNGRLITPQG